MLAASRTALRPRGGSSARSPNASNAELQDEELNLVKEALSDLAHNDWARPFNDALPHLARHLPTWRAAEREAMEAYEQACLQLVALA